MPTILRLTILKTGIDTVSHSSAGALISEWTEGHKSRYVVAANVHVVMTAYGDQSYAKVLAKADLVTPDGMPLVLALKLLGNPAQTRVAGPDLMLYWCANYPQIPIFLYGSDTPTLSKLETFLKTQFPTLAIAGSYAPPIWDRAIETNYPYLQSDLDLIRQSGAKVVFVALGCPKQEFWMAQAVALLNKSFSSGDSSENSSKNSSKNSSPAMIFIGVGAAFAIHSGTVPRAPQWMQKLALEWLYRLWQEPRRLWRRYIFNNPSFLVLVTLQILKFQLFSKGR